MKVAPPLNFQKIWVMSNKSAVTNTLPWIEKYRPATLDDLVSHEDIVGTIKKLIDANRLPHLLFYGPPGTGKTSTVLAIAREMYGLKTQTMVLELNASDARGIDTVRNEIQNFAGTRKLFSSGVKLIILDEADNMTKDAQNALRRVVEKYTSNARFCLICNYASKIIPALQSRCTRFRFAPVKPNLVLNRVSEILAKENVTITEKGLESVLKLGSGDMRKILNILQSAAMANGNKIDEETVFRSTGKPTEADMKLCIKALLEESVKDCFATLKGLQVQRGLALLDILTEIHAHFMCIDIPPKMRIMITKEMSQIEHNLSNSTAETLQLGALVAAFVFARQYLQIACNSMDAS